MNSYEDKLQEYEDWKEEMEEVSTDLEIEGNNPEVNRRIEREELKKRSIEMMSSQRFDSFDAATNGILNVSGYPEILFEEAKAEGRFVKYFEQVYDWANMTYIFYPYFYGKKRNWLTITRIDDNDPLFTKFLQSGYARVVVPIKKGMEDYAGSFCGLLAWLTDTDPSDIVGVDEEWYISIAQELMEAEGISKETPKYVNSYEQKVPTNLVYIVPEGHVEGTPWSGLPDNSNDEDIVDPHLWFLTDGE